MKITRKYSKTMEEIDIEDYLMKKKKHKTEHRRNRYQNTFKQDK